MALKVLFLLFLLLLDFDYKSQFLKELFGEISYILIARCMMLPRVLLRLIAEENAIILRLWNETLVSIGYSLDENRVNAIGESGSLSLQIN